MLQPVMRFWIRMHKGSARRLKSSKICKKVLNIEINFFHLHLEIFLINGLKSHETQTKNIIFSSLMNVNFVLKNSFQADRCFTPNGVWSGSAFKRMQIRITTICKVSNDLSYSLLTLFLTARNLPWHPLTLHGSAWFCMILLNFAWICLIMHD